VYKFPRLGDSEREVVRTGVGQVYMDVNDQRWKLLDKKITDREGHAVYNTLQQIYSGHRSRVCTLFLFSEVHIMLAVIWLVMIKLICS